MDHKRAGDLGPGPHSMRPNAHPGAAHTGASKGNSGASGANGGASSADRSANSSASKANSGTPYPGSSRQACATRDGPGPGSGPVGPAAIL
jgi:hypothetical protein